MADQHDVDNVVSAGGKKPKPGPTELDDYSQLVWEVFGKGTKGAKWLEIVYRDQVISNALVVPGEPYVTTARAAVADFIFEIIETLEIAENVRK